MALPHPLFQWLSLRETKKERRELPVLYPGTDLIDHREGHNRSTGATLRIAVRLTGKVATKGLERSAECHRGMIDLGQGEYVMFAEAGMRKKSCWIQGFDGYIEKWGRDEDKNYRRNISEI